MKLKIGVIGGGNMGAAIVSKIKNKYNVSVCEKDSARQKFIKSKFKVRVGDLTAIVKNAKIIILAVKPQDFDQILREVAAVIRQDQLVISIAAGITTQYIEKRLGAGIKVIRTMPNLPAQIGQGMTGICIGKNATRADLKQAVKIFDNIGKTIVVQEKWMDAITAVSGSGPAYVFLFVECLMNAAKNLGFNEEQAKTLINQTLRGSLSLLENSKDDAQTLRSFVTSKGGTTLAAMDVFFAKDIEDIFTEALKAAKKRAAELAK